jgi:hypothetical protein
VFFQVIPDEIQADGVDPGEKPFARIELPEISIGRETDESLVFELPVQGEGRCNPQKPHGFKTHAINKT